jgi:hypothetical protein
MGRRYMQLQHMQRLAARQAHIDGSAAAASSGGVTSLNRGRGKERVGAAVIVSGQQGIAATPAAEQESASSAASACHGCATCPVCSGHALGCLCRYTQALQEHLPGLQRAAGGLIEPLRLPALPCLHEGLPACLRAASCLPDCPCLPGSPGS